MKTIPRRFLLFVFILFSGTCYAQCGDSCANATPLTVSVTGICNYVSCTNIGATPSGLSGLPCSAVSNNDVWYTFTVPAGVTVLQGEVLGGGPGNMNYPTLYFYRGNNCSALTSLGCSTGFPPASKAIVTYANFIPGEQIWVRVKPLGGTLDGVFQLCVYDPCPSGSPVNDDPCFATFIPVGTNCSSYTSVTNNCATASVGIPDPGCGNYLGGDVWVQTTVGASGHLQANFQLESILNVSCALYSGTCGSLNLVACDDDGGPNQLPYLFVDSLVPGDTIWIRIWAYGNIAFGTTGICLTDPCPAGAPLNDDPCNATMIAMSASCAAFTTLSNVCAGASPGIPSPGCGNYLGGDIWIQTVGVNGELEINFQEQSVADMACAAYTGTCGSLALRGCSDIGGPGLMPYLFVSGLAPSDTVWIRIWSPGNTAFGTVGVCLTDPCPIGVPPNDNPCNATLIPYSANCLAYTTLSNSCATGTTGVPAPGCGLYAGKDVWVKAVVPPNGHLEINFQQQAITDADCAVYTGTCSILTLVDCDDRSGPGNMPYLYLSSLTPNDTVWIRIWVYNNSMMGTLGICISDPCPSGSVPYDNPCNAYIIPLVAACNADTILSNACATTTLGIPDPGCGNYAGNDMWIQAIIGSSGMLEVNFEEMSIDDMAAAVYAGVCDTLFLLACDDDGGPGLMPYLFINYTPGDTVWIRVWAYGNSSSGSVGMCLLDPCPTNTVIPPLFEDPPCPLPDSSSSYLPVGNGTCTNYVMYSSQCANATFSTFPPNVPVPVNCSGPGYPPGAATGWDVWAPCIVPDSPATGFINFISLPSSIYDLDLALYRITPPAAANCSDGTMYSLVSCDDSSAAFTQMPAICQPYGGINVVQPGDTLLVRMWRHMGGPSGNWYLAVKATPFAPNEICMVTVDTSTGKNVVVWEKQTTAGIESFRIFKETSPGIFNWIASIPADLPSLYLDASSNPFLKADRYTITTMDSCAVESSLSPIHGTVHLTINPDTSGGWHLDWNLYEGLGFTTYYIMRGNVLNNLAVIDSVQAPLATYVDSMPPAGAVYYAVEMRKPASCNPQPGSLIYQASRSNVVVGLPSGMHDAPSPFYGISIRPNPILNSSTISFNLERREKVRIRIVDITGREINSLVDEQLSQGKYQFMWSALDYANHTVPAGIYFIRFEAGNFSETRKAVVLKKE